MSSDQVPVAFGPSIEITGYPEGIFHDHASSFSEGGRRCCRHRHRLLRLRSLARRARPAAGTAENSRHGGGEQVKRIDVHAHCQFREAGALLDASAAAGQLPTSLVDGRPFTEVAAVAFIEINKRLAAIDAQAVDMEVLSINPFWYGRERDLASQIVKLQNEKLTKLCASKPDRFAAFASLTLRADFAVQELETAVKKRGLRDSDRRHCQWRGIFRSEISSSVGQGGRTRRAPVHSSDGHPRAREKIGRQRFARQHDGLSPWRRRSRSRTSSSRARSIAFRSSK